jgi:hypothetical protein
MATTDNIETEVGPFTLVEALEYLKYLDKQPTMRRATQWVNIKTGEEVIIGGANPKLEKL